MTTFDRNLSGSRARETLSECKELHKKRGRHPIQLLYEDFFEQSYVCLIKKKKSEVDIQFSCSMKIFSNRAMCA
jgi:hypothetical protein